jgi:SAM-dependent methyltransferase
LKIYRFFKEPKFHDAEFYKDREPADHLKEPAHYIRLMRTLSDIEWVLDIDKRITSVSDLGCGTGGLLSELKKRRPNVEAWGFDLSPKAVEFAKREYGVDAELGDFTQDSVELGDVTVLTETLEHLVDPVGLLEKIKRQSKWVIASVPAAEDDKKHYEYHLWAWEPEAFRYLFESVGYSVVLHYVLDGIGTQYMVAKCA